jgi:hypothetical protein
MIALSIAMVSTDVTCAQRSGSSWLDEPKPPSWNKTGAPIPAAPRIQGNLDPRCKDQARPPQLEEDRRVRDQGWNLVGAFQGGWQVLVIRATASYDGMCRPRQYQDFIFVRGVFAGTLSPQAMESRTDGALGRVSLQSTSRLTAEYDRYAATDPFVRQARQPWCSTLRTIRQSCGRCLYPPPNGEAGQAINGLRRGIVL